MRKLFFLFVALFATTCLWAHDFEVNGIYYNYLNENNVEVTYSHFSNSEKYSGEVIIPSTITYNRTTYNVTSIGERAFSQCSSLTSVTIPNSVTSIGNSAFSGCSSLTSITIPNSVTSIGNYAFYNCSSLTSLTIPESVMSIGDRTFDGCSALSSITIPNSVTSIGYSAFYGCTFTKQDFINNSSLNAQEQNYWEAKIVDEDIDGMLIRNDTIIDCRPYAKSASIPNKITTIGNSAFSDCSSLSSITIPNSVTSIGDWAFSGCSSLSKTNYTGDMSDWCKIKFGINSSNPISQSHNLYINDEEIKDLILPNTIDSIYPYAFEGCFSLTSITIPNSVTSIGDYAFHECYDLNSIIVESGNRIYDSRENCNAIIETKNNTLIVGCKTTIIPNQITTIGKYAFDNCDALTSITLPNSVISIEYAAFRDCDALTSIIVPNNVTTIGDYTFYSCDSLASVIIGNSVTSIGKLAFFGCSSLISLSISNNLTSIGRAAFTATPWIMNQPEGLLYFGNILYTYVGDIPENAEIVIKEGTTMIVGGAFQNSDHNKSTTRNITSFTIPQSVKFIGSYAFSSSINYDYGLKINYLGSIEDWCDIVFEDSRANPLSGSDVQIKLYINDSVITELTIPNTIDSIHDYTFYGYRSLTSVTIPKNVKFIGTEAFYNCGIKDVYLQSTTPPVLSKKSRKNFSSNPVCYIPCGSQAEYAASDWAIQVEYFEEYYPYSLSIASSNEDWGIVEEPTCEGGIIITATPKIGYQFVKWSDGNTDNPRKLELAQDTTLVAEFAQAFSGQCGDNLYWSYDEGSKTISISGTGNMYDYTPTTQPWILFKEELKEVAIANTATSLGKSAFAGSIRLAKVEIGANVENIADSVFAGCNRLYHVYCYPTYPPFAEQSSFANYNVYLHVPCEEKEAYELDMIWGNFKNIECIGAESENITTDDVIVSPSTDNVTITWPTEDNADTYSIVIEKDNEVFCTLTFNADGLLLNIAFAPARNGNHHAAQYAAQTTKGLRFTVTGLEEATTYAYNITAKDASDKTIKSHSGEFTTQSNTSTDVDNLNHSVESAQKLLRDSQLLIIRNGVEYSVMGQEM